MLSTFLGLLSTSKCKAIQPTSVCDLSEIWMQDSVQTLKPHSFNIAWSWMCRNCVARSEASTTAIESIPRRLRSVDLPMGIDNNFPFFSQTGQQLFSTWPLFFPHEELLIFHIFVDSSNHSICEYIWICIAPAIVPKIFHSRTICGRLGNFENFRVIYSSFRQIWWSMESYRK